MAEAQQSIKPEACPRMMLNSGHQIPVVGLGTFKNKEQTCALVKSAILEHGYRHIDTARVYENEGEIGQALEECMQAGVTREELFITTKLWMSGYDDIEGTCRESLRLLKLEYLDCYMIHWMLLPLDFDSEDWMPKTPPFHVIWQQMESLVDKGLVRSIAVSNCTIPMMINLLAGCRIKPCMNQVELNPYITQPDVLRFHKKWGIALEGYATIGGDGAGMLSDPVLNEIATAKGFSPAQVAISWGVRRGTIPLIKTSNHARLTENMASVNVELTDEEVDKIDALNKNMRKFDPINWGGQRNLPYFF